ncbi:MAG TPA: hypothetical protein DCK95_05760 [Anaerolineaceae bacterium]|uniref:Putative membrane protein n=1 Tax=Anaerolinea thermophila TaxID=167964 RepID=A0A117LH47_9CHLR|nr:MAG: putative membrane protein [Anaerolinea thermophila]HAF61813.1 hypothetical protein [Anaerolineaceae bacterium]
MISLGVLFWVFILLFALIGAIRGWTKEILVTFSAIMGIFAITILEEYLPFVQTYLASNPVTSQVWMRIIVFSVLIFFGYQTPNIPRFQQDERLARGRLQDILLGFIIGGFNGYLIYGSIWYFLADANYPFPIVIPPIAGTPAGDAALNLVKYLPPVWLTTPTIYYAVACSFIFVLVLFI